MGKILSKTDLPPKKVDIALLHENTWNPNRVADAEYQALVNALNTDEGNYRQPVLVRPHPTIQGHYEIVDGAHRYRAMKENFDQLFVIVEALSDKEARLTTISMNKLRGQFDSIELAELIIELKNTYGVTHEEFQKMAGYTEDEIKGFESLVNFDASQFDSELKVEDEEKMPEVADELILSVTPFQKECILELGKIFGVDELGVGVAAAALYIGVQNTKGQLDQDLSKNCVEKAVVGETPEDEAMIEEAGKF